MAPKNIIYGLIDPRTETLRYIGKSTQGMKRARSHSYPRSLERDRSRTGCWIKSLKRAGLAPISELLGVGLNGSDLPSLERFWIASIRATGATLYNHTDGGDGCLGRPMGAVTKAALLTANLGSKRNSGKVRSKETRDKMRTGASLRSDNKRPVIINTTETMVPSIRRAATALGIHNSVLGKCLKGTRPWPDGVALARYSEAR